MTSPRADDYLPSQTSRGQTAAAPLRGSGCLSGFLIPPLTVLLVGALLALFSSSLTVPAQAVAGTGAAPPAGVPARQPGLAPLFTPEVQFWAGHILAWSAETGLDPNLIATVMQIESCGDPLARSRAGAMGLFQVMPYHFKGGENPYNPETNALRGLAYLAKSLDTADGDFRLALAGYNGGIGVIARAESFWAAETLRYVYWGSGIYGEARQGASESARLQEWLGKGGASLCNQANQRLGLFSNR
ncbi:MAG: lytic transglycosylase domain-containing protein [Chloroflexi bacterium]|nr:lytic transglycosylase domain-containing protein [Chloroflexota bacterium]